MPEYIGGHQFAIPDVNTLKTSNWSNALGGVGFGPRGEHYRVLYLNEAASVTVTAGQLVFLETGTAEMESTNTAESRAAQFQPWVIMTASGTANWAGVVASSAFGQGLAIVQVGGPVTLFFSGASTAHRSAQNAWFLPADTAGNMASTDLGTATNATVVPFLGAAARMLGYSVSGTSAVMNIVPPTVFLFG